MSDSRATIAILCTLGVVLLVASSLTRSWWRFDKFNDSRVRVGLWSAEVCVGDRARDVLAPEHRPPRDAPCTVRDLAELPTQLDANWDRFLVDDVWNPRGDEPPPVGLARTTGAITGILALLLAGLLAAAGAATMLGGRRRGPRLLARAAGVAGWLLLVVAGQFLATAPVEIHQMMFGLGPACAFAGGLFAIAVGRQVGDREPDEQATAPDNSRSRGAAAAMGLGVLLVLVSLHTRTWWYEDDFRTTHHGLVDGEVCVDDWTPPCEVETWNQQPEGVTGPRPTADRIAFQVGKLAFLLGSLAVFLGLATIAIVVAGQRPPMRRYLIGLAIGFAAASIALCLGPPPSTISDGVRLSTGPLWALVGAALLVASARRLARSEHRDDPLPRAISREGKRRR